MVIGKQKNRDIVAQRKASVGIGLLIVFTLFRSGRAVTWQEEVSELGTWAPSLWKAMRCPLPSRTEWAAAQWTKLHWKMINLPGNPWICYQIYLAILIIWVTWELVGVVKQMWGKARGLDWPVNDDQGGSAVSWRRYKTGKTRRIPRTASCNKHKNRVCDFFWCF